MGGQQGQDPNQRVVGLTVRSGFDGAISPASYISSTVDLRNFLTCSGVTLEWFGSIFALVPFLLLSTPAVRVGLG